MLDTEKLHPDYLEESEAWRYLRDFYTGGSTVAESYLWQHPLEADKSFVRRKREAVDYRNYCELVVSIYASHIYAAPPRRELSSAARDYELDVDRQGTNANVFFKRVIQDAMVEGVRHVLVDMPSLPEDTVNTKAAVQASGIRPYCVSLSPTQIVDWDVEYKDPRRIGQLNYVVIMGTQWSCERVPFQTRSQDTTYTVWYPDRWEKWVEIAKSNSTKDSELRLISQGRHGFGRVPLATFYDRKKKDMIGVSALKDIAPLCHKLLNEQSLQFEAEKFGSVPLLFLMTKEDIKTLDVGHYRATRLNPGDDVKYVSPDAMMIESMRSTTREIKEDILRVAIKQIAPPQEAGPGETTEKRRIDRQEFVSSLVDKSTNFEEGELLVWQLMAIGAGGKPDETKVTYDKKFSHQTVAEELAAALNVRDISIPSAAFNVEYWMRVVDTLFPDLTEVKRKEIVVELKKAAEEEAKAGAMDEAKVKSALAQAESLAQQSGLRDKKQGKG